jgi:predicted nucleotidyltransferase
VLTAERQRALERVRRIVLDALRGRPARVYLFGSSASGSARSSSDIDVAIEPLESLPPGVLSSLREALEESTIPYDVDVVDISAAPPELRERVRQQGILWTD